MKKILTIIMLFGVCYGYAQNTPRYAASAKTWKFGNQTWSDAIQIPECNKSSFENSDTAPQCRNYTEDSNTWYYYNWAYVKANAAKLCPSPWRVPSKEDFELMVELTDENNLMSAWGRPGLADDSSVHLVGSLALFRSTTAARTARAYVSHYDHDSMGVLYTGIHYGLPVHCVR
ncbi:MAG: fibrobacter succinogenes major paralogous domain-containing protein [Prevotellaceae bacterium]|nr:fibrobacter succinogenes major paralogous domain-containing protein [Prevotellaceae bacterium]